MFEPVHAAPAEGGRFAPRWDCLPPRFAMWGDRSAVSDAAPADDNGADNLWLSGFAAGRADAEADVARAANAMDALVCALDRLAPLPDADFAERLEREVRSLLGQLVGSASIDDTLLAQRCAALAELASSNAASVLHANPGDVALLTKAQPALTIIADDRLPRGELLLIDGAGEAAAGPHTMLADWVAQAGEVSC